MVVSTMVDAELMVAVAAVAEDDYQEKSFNILLSTYLTYILIFRVVLLNISSFSQSEVRF